jgi:pimeloyl-ACP methyl ester carboxylesterase
MRTVHARLERDPVKIAIKDEQGRELQLVIGKLDVQLVTSFSIADPQTIARVPAMYAQMQTGDFSTVGQIIYNYIRSPHASTFRGMPEAMDIASGISEARLKLVQSQARTALLADALNFPMPHLAGALKGLDLGDDFRSPVSSSVPTLFISGTLDGRTYPESAIAISAKFNKATHVIVENGGHNIFEAAPEIGEMIVRYMRGSSHAAPAITLPPPQFMIVPTPK